MNARSFALVCVFFALLTFLTIRTGSATVVTFDDLHETASGSFIANSYQGLVWSNFLALNGILRPTVFPVTNGLYFGVESASNIVINGGPGYGAEIDSPGTNLDFLSAYLTGGINSNLNIEIQGFSGTTILYDTTVVVSATNSTLFTFNYLNINR